MFAMYIGIVFLKRFRYAICAASNSKVPVPSLRQKASTKLRGKETFRQEVRSGFGPDSYLETPACFLFFWPTESWSWNYNVFERNPLERSEVDLHCGLCTNQTGWVDNPEPPAMSSALSGGLNSSNASSWMTPSSSWLPASHKRGPCWWLLCETEGVLKSFVMTDIVHCHANFKDKLQTAVISAGINIYLMLFIHSSFSSAVGAEMR